MLSTFKKLHKKEHKLPPNSKIQKTDPLVSLVSLRSGTWPFTFANRHSLRSWRDFVRECFCFGFARVKYDGSAAARPLTHPATQAIIVKTFLLHSAAEFLCERKSSIFWRRQKSCSIHHRQIRLRTPKERAVFSDCLGRIWSPQSLSHQLNKILCHPSHPSHPTDFFATQILGGHVTSRNQSLSSNDQGRQRRETLGTRLAQRVNARSLAIKLFKLFTSDE